MAASRRIAVGQGCDFLVGTETFSLALAVQGKDQAPPLAMMWNTNPSTVIPTATAAIGSRTSAVALAPLTGPVEVSNSPTAQS
jgi:hypothetical protein